VGWTWDVKYVDFEGSNEDAAARFYLYRRVPLVLVAIGHDKNFEQAVMNLEALMERFSGREDAELASVVKSIDD
jgi:hypothetical protein